MTWYHHLKPKPKYSAVHPRSLLILLSIERQWSINVIQLVEIDWICSIGRKHKTTTYLASWCSSKGRSCKKQKRNDFRVDGHISTADYCRVYVNWTCESHLRRAGRMCATYVVMCKSVEFWSLKWGQQRVEWRFWQQCFEFTRKIFNLSIGRNKKLSACWNEHFAFNIAVFGTHYPSRNTTILHVIYILCVWLLFPVKFSVM